MVRTPTLEEVRASELKFWDQIAAGYRERARPSISTLSFPFASSSDRIFLDSLGDISGKRVLDVGCGFGDLTVVLKDKGAEVCGLDIAKSMIRVGAERARHYHVSVEFAVGDAESLPFASESFDAVVGMRALHHFPDIPSFLREVRRTLRPGGKAAFIEPQKYNPIVEMNRRIFRPEFHSEYEHALTPRDIRDAKEVFPNLETRAFYLISPAAFMFERIVKNRELFEKSYMALQRFESRLGDSPLFRRYCWQTLILARKDRTPAGPGA